MRLPLEILAIMREAVPKTKGLWMRISATDWWPEGEQDDKGEWISWGIEQSKVRRRLSLSRPPSVAPLPFRTSRADTHSSSSVDLRQGGDQAWRRPRRLLVGRKHAAPEDLGRPGLPGPVRRADPPLALGRREDPDLGRRPHHERAAGRGDPAGRQGRRRASLSPSPSSLSRTRTLFLVSVTDSPCTPLADLRRARVPARSGPRPRLGAAARRRRQHARPVPARLHAHDGQARREAAGQAALDRRAQEGTRTRRRFA